MNLAAAPAVAPAVVPYGTIAVTDSTGTSTVEGTLTGPAAGGVSISGTTIGEAVSAAREQIHVADPGLRAVFYDAGAGALLVRPVEMSQDAAHLFGSRSYGSATITDAAPGMLGIFDGVHVVGVTSSPAQ